MATGTLITADELLRLPKEQRCELINGELIPMPPSGYRHGYVNSEIAYQIRKYLELNPVGKIFGAETGFFISRTPDTVRAPEVAFVRTERLPQTLGSGYFPGPPDLAVEVVSPHDPYTEVMKKVTMWLEAGAVAVWTVDPQRKIAMIHQWDAGQITARETTELTCPDLLPGLTIFVENVLETLTKP